MKPLRQLNNVEKAQLLHQLLPGDMPALITRMQEVTQNIVDNPDSVREKWQPNPVITVDSWINLATEINKITKSKEYHLAKSPKVFADQLFSGWLAITSNHIIEVHAARADTSKEFKNAVEFFYNSY